MVVPDNELKITKFASQTLLGYRTDAEGNTLTKIFEGVVILSDQSTRTIYGIIDESSLMISWDFSEIQEKPLFNRDPLGIEIKK
jgi:hypothetical protein